ncbi:MAG: cobalamin-dependent protein [Gemmatimonadota bacterium]|nr:cobalamin-dependent protein [Gemmatimonadota bacterium]
MTLSDAKTSHLAPEAPHAELARSYLEHLLAGRRTEAGDLVLDAVRAGTHVKQVYLHVFQPVQWEIGRLWQTDRISVAKEHFCTAATQLIISQLYPWVFSGVRERGTMVATAVPGELHELGIRMVADFFEMAGWETAYLGANVPADGVAQMVDEKAADVLAVSASLLEHVDAVREVVDTVRALPGRDDLIILVGGHPFNADPELWRSLGANGYAHDAEQAVARAEAMVPGRGAS